MIATFRSRNATVKVYNILTGQYKMSCALVSTPRQANVGCGLSIKFNSADYDFLAQNLPSVETFSGIFRVSNIGGKTIVTRV